MKKVVLFITLLVTVVFVLFFTGKLDFSKPKIEFVEKPDYLGENANIILDIKSGKSGLSNINVWISQNNNRVEIYKENLNGLKEKRLNISFNTRKSGLLEGKALLHIEVSNNAIIKRTNIVESQTNIDYTPPTISIVSSTQNIINGETGFAFVKSSENLKNIYVKVEDFKFKCIKLKDSYVCPFSLPYFYEETKPIVLEAYDYANNKSTNSIYYTFKRVNYSKSILNIDDNFIETKVRPLSDKNILDKVELFKYVNIEIRKRNEDTIHKITSECKNPNPMFEGKFEYLENSAKLGGFADYRKYRYNGNIIEGADAYHKGFDFASIKNAEVKASNNGKVVFTGFLGIYGNSIIIDHGLCVYSLYSHLSEIAVKNGDVVKKGQYIGKTGTTGLAVGDHLHFGILVDGIEVNPIEWFDLNWMNTRFYNYYKGGN